MKINVNEVSGCEETEITITCAEVDDEVLGILAAVRMREKRFTGVKDGKTFMLEPSDVFYAESVDKKTFFYTHKEVYETPLRLYELEERLAGSGFFRAGKSLIVNLKRVKVLIPSFGGKIEVTLENGERMVVSRQYVPHLKSLLGL